MLMLLVLEEEEGEVMLTLSLTLEGEEGEVITLLLRPLLRLLPEVTKPLGVTLEEEELELVEVKVIVLDPLLPELLPSLVIMEGGVIKPLPEEEEEEEGKPPIAFIVVTVELVEVTGLKVDDPISLLCELVTSPA